MISLLHTDDDDVPIVQHSVMLSHVFKKKKLSVQKHRAVEIDWEKRNQDCKHCGWITLRYYITHTRKNEKNHHKFKDTDRHTTESLCTTAC
jgi:hypothetical protein